MALGPGMTCKGVGLGPQKSILADGSMGDWAACSNIKLPFLCSPLCCSLVLLYSHWTGH